MTQANSPTPEPKTVPAQKKIAVRLRTSRPGYAEVLFSPSDDVAENTKLKDTSGNLWTVASLGPVQVGDTKRTERFVKLFPLLNSYRAATLKGPASAELKHGDVLVA